jgi:hypothetical protein
MSMFDVARYLVYSNSIDISSVPMREFSVQQVEALSPADQVLTRSTKRAEMMRSLALMK